MWDCRSPFNLIWKQEARNNVEFEFQLNWNKKILWQEQANFELFLTCSQTRYMVKWKYSFAAKWKRKVYNCTTKVQYLTSGFSKLWPHIPWSIFLKKSCLLRLSFNLWNFECIWKSSPCWQVEWKHQQILSFLVWFYGFTFYTFLSIYMLQIRVVGGNHWINPISFPQLLTFWIAFVKYSSDRKLCKD